MASEARMIGYELLKTLETIGRGKAALRWLERLKGRKLMQLVGQ